MPHCGVRMDLHNGDTAVSSMIHSNLMLIRIQTQLLLVNSAALRGRRNDGAPALRERMPSSRAARFVACWVWAVDQPLV